MLCCSYLYNCLRGVCMYYAYAFINLIVYIIYAVFLIIGAQTTQPLFGLLPLLIFYTAKYTGAFFWYTFSTIQTTQLFKWLIFCAVAGSILGIAAPKYPAVLNISALLFGLCCSVLLPTYNTILKQKKNTKKRPILWSIILACCWLVILLPALTTRQFSFAFLWLGLAFFFLLFLPVKIMNDTVPYTKKALRYTGIAAFIVLSIALFIVKFARTVEWQTFFSTIVLLLLFALVCVTIWYAWRSVCMFPLHLHLYSYADGLFVTFFFMTTVFKHWVTTGSLYMVYIPYILGLLIAFVLPIKPSKNLLMLLLLLCSWGLLYAPLLPIVAIGVGFCHTKLSTALNRAYYDVAAITVKDESLLIKNRFYRLGGISIQLMIVALIVVIAWQRTVDLPQLMHALVPTALPLLFLLFNGGMTVFVSWLLVKAYRLRRA